MQKQQKNQRKNGILTKLGKLKDKASGVANKVGNKLKEKIKSGVEGAKNGLILKINL